MDTFPPGPVNNLEGLPGKSERGYDKLFIIVSEKAFQSSQRPVLNIFSSLNTSSCHLPCGCLSEERSDEESQSWVKNQLNYGEFLRSYLAQNDVISG